MNGKVKHKRTRSRARPGISDSDSAADFIRTTAPTRWSNYATIELWRLCTRRIKTVRFSRGVGNVFTNGFGPVVCTTRATRVKRLQTKTKRTYHRVRRIMYGRISITYKQREYIKSNGTKKKTKNTYGLPSYVIK